MSSALESYVNHTVSVITADGRLIVIDDLIDLYREYANVPIPLRCELYDEHKNRNRSLRLVWKIRDLDTMEGTAFAKHYNIKLSKDNQMKDVSIIGDPIDCSNELLYSRGSKYTAILRKGPKDAESGKPKQLIEIWNKQTKLKSIDVNTLDDHSNVIVDGQFSTFKWSPNGKQLLYIAEYKYPKAQSFYKKKRPEECKDKSECNKTEGFGEENAYLEDWGEALDGIHHTIACVLDAETYKIKVINMKGHSIGQAFWIGSGDAIGFVAWCENPQRIGLIYCTNRESAIYMYDLIASDSTPKLLTDGQKLSVRSPRVNSFGTEMVYLENESGGPHHKASRLIHYDFKTNTKTIVIDNRDTRKVLPIGDVYSKPAVLYLHEDLPDNCFTDDGKHIMFQSIDVMKTCLCIVSLNDKALNVLSFPMDSVKVLDIRGDIIVAIGSSLNYKPNVYVGKFNAVNNSEIKWEKIENDFNESISDVTFESFSIPSGDDPKKLVYSMLIGPKKSEKSAAPTIIVPHGGPHSAFYNTYFTYPILFAKLGLKTLMVNFRGSIGIDESYVNTLCSRIGEMDVKDMVLCMTNLIEKGLIDKSKMVLMGGSHGGFLVTQLSGQHSDMGFKACIARNPVVDIAGMTEGTDIPDWAYTEVLGLDVPYNFKSVPNSDILKKMFEKSSMFWIDNVKVPTLLTLGSKDRRVPYTQGLKYYRALKARGIETECRMYDDKHDLAKVNVDSDAFIHIALWILKHLKD